MHHVEPKVYLIARSEASGHMPRWLKELGVSDEAVERITSEDNTSAEKIIEAAGRRCYKSFDVGMNPNVTQIRKDIGDYIENILKVKHGSVIEHATFTFAIENVSRVFTGEMNRHRAGVAISEGSMRFIRYTDIPYWVPTSIRFGKNKPETEIEVKQARTQDVFDKAFTAAEDFYKELLEIWKEELSPESKFKAKKEITSMMRRIIPMGVATGGIWTLNLRALRHVCEMRCSAAAEEEILYVITKVLEIMRVEEPNFFGDFVTDENGISTPKYSKV